MAHRGVMGGLLWCLCLAAAIFAPVVSPAQPDNEAGIDQRLETLESLVAQWSDLRLTLAEEERAWEEDHEHLEREIDLLQKERSVLVKTMETENATENPVDGSRPAILREQNRLVAISDALPALIGRAEASLRAWPARLPPPFRKPLDEAFRPIVEEQEKGAPPRVESYGARLERVVALYTEIERLQSTIHVVREMLPGKDGTRREVDVCYIGLARAFAVSADNTWAATGTPSDAGWKWREDPMLAPRIRQAVSVSRREQEITAVVLPLAIHGDAP